MYMPYIILTCAPHPQWYENLLIGAYWMWILNSGDSRLIVTDILTAAIGASLGVFLFHIQHTFEGAYKVRALLSAPRLTLNQSYHSAPLSRFITQGKVHHREMKTIFFGCVYHHAYNKTSA
jgi:hypothetical protein